MKKLRIELKKQRRRGRGQQRVLKAIHPILRGVYNYAAKFSSGKMWRQLGKVDFEVAKRIQKLDKTYDLGQIKFADILKTTKYLSPPKGATWLVNQEYWDKRNLMGLSPRKKALYKAPTGRCPHGKGKFTFNENEVLETPHLKPKSMGGKDRNSNVRLFQAPCQKQLHQREAAQQK